MQGDIRNYSWQGSVKWWKDLKFGFILDRIVGAMGQKNIKLVGNVTWQVFTLIMLRIIFGDSRFFSVYGNYWFNPSMDNNVVKWPNIP